MTPSLTPHGIFLLRTLIAFMDGLIDERFTMMMYERGCGSPACAWGNARTLPAFQFCLGGSTAGIDQMEAAFGKDHYYIFCELFQANLSRIIHTPQQWAAHARAKLVEWGYDNAAPQVEASSRQNSALSEAVSARMIPVADNPVGAAPDPAWQRVRAKMLEPVGVA